MAQLAVRTALPEEFERVAELTVAAYARVLGDELGEYRDELADVATRAKSADVLVAVGAEGVVGAVTYVPGADSPLLEFEDPDAAGIRMLAVDPAFQGLGAGRMLTEACVARAREARRRRVLLYSTAPMVIARAMYERMGFRRDEDRDWPFEREDGSTFVLLCYVLELDAPTP